MNIVVIGNGMAGSRFAEDMATASANARITVLGKEPIPAYNRVLLSNVIAGGSNPAQLSIEPANHERVQVLIGTAAVAVDRRNRTVIDTRGDTHPWDELVFATGSSARIPAIQGVADAYGLIPGVSVLKDLADADKILRDARQARRAIVLGAGVLGLEVATGLAKRGIEVSLVHHAERLMQRQLGWEAAAIASSNLSRMGISVLTEASIAAVVTHRGHVNAVRLEDHSEIPTDMVVMCCGTLPDISLARNAGLSVDRGMLVTKDLDSVDDEHVHAIGDCAQPPEGATGLVAQGWEQASRLAARLSGTQVVTQGAATDIVRVKASGMSMATMGITGDFDRSDPRLRVLSLKDPEAGRFVEVVVSDGLLVGATCIGDKAIAADLTVVYTRRIPVPKDPAQLMVHALVGNAIAAKDPAEMKDADTVCNCNSVTKEQISAAIQQGCDSVECVARCTRATTGCGDCKALVGKLVSGTVAPLAAVGTQER